jgi:tetratricopeptide (TPR) repeat protein
MKTYSIILLLLLSLLLGSCEKYLDIKSDSQLVFIESSQDCQRLLDNYSVLNVSYPSDGEASAGDYYMTDASYNGSARTGEDRGIYTWQTTVLRNSAGQQWTPCYFKIYNTNLVLEALDDLSDTPEQATLDGLRGAALFYRAFSFWQLAQLYAPPYSAATAGQDPGIPIRLTSDINEVSVRGTVKQTYDRIVQDLKEAVNLLPSTVPIASRPGKAAALAMLARVYISMEDYEQALTTADAALQLKNDLLNYSSLSTTSNTPFARFNTEVIFQAVMNTNSLITGGITASNVAKVDPALVASYATNDLRRTIFLKAVAGNLGTFSFTGNYEPTTNGTLFVGLATDELYLVRAECYARAGNVASAMADLNTLLRTRWNGPYTNLTASSADEALSKVLTERRKELLMRGLRWTDLRRLNRDNRFAVTLNRTILGQVYQLTPGDLRYTLLIPNEVIINSGIKQNSR